MRNILLIYFLSLSFLNGQELDKAKFEEGVDFVTCICINTASQKEIVDCKKDIIRQSDIPAGEKATIALFQELQALKKETRKNASFLSEEIFENEKKFQKINAFAKKRKGAALDTIKLKIKNFLTTEETQFLTSDPPENSIEPAIPEETSQPLEVLNTIEEKKQKPIMERSFFEENSILLILSAVLIIAIIYVFWVHWNLKKKFQEVNDRIGRRVKISKDFPSSNQKIESKTNSNLENKIEELSRKILDLENTIAKMQTTENLEKNLSTNMLQAKSQVANEVFYMAVPNEDGSFDNDGKTSKEAALYEFIIDSQNPSVAKFSFTAKDIKIIQSVVDYSQSYINPVCEPQNALNQNAKQIVTIRPGIAEKRNDKWIITNKAQIKYE